MPHSADALPAGVVAHRDLAYVSGGHPRQVLDLYLPRAAAPLPLIVWIHGGAFRRGSKENRVPLEMLEQLSPRRTARDRTIVTRQANAGAVCANERSTP